MIRMLGVMLSLLLLGSPVGATYYFASPAGGDSAVCTDIDSTDIAVRPASYGTISRAAECATVAGDVVVVRGGLGTYTGSTHQINLQTMASTALASGTSASNMTQVIGDPADPIPQISVNGWYLSYTPSPSSIRHWVRIAGLNVDGTGGADNVVMLAGTNLLVENNILHNSQASCIFTRGDVGDAFHTVRHNELYDCGTDGNGYGVYSGADDAVIEYNNIHDTYGQGGQFVWVPKTGGPRRGIFRYNWVHGVIKSTISTINGCLGWAVSGPDAEIYSNIFDMSSCSSNPSISTGISLLGANGSNAKIHNNVFTGTTDEVIYVGPFGTSTGATIYNNVFDVVAGVAIRTANSSTYTATYNACKTADNCATANKIVITAITDITISTSDFRHKTTSLGLNAGTSVSTRTCVGVCDLGPYEQGTVVVGGLSIGGVTIDTPFSTVDSIGVLPTVGITQVTIGCTGTDCGTPVVSTVSVKSGSTGVISTTLTGIGGTGLCIAGQAWTQTLGSSTNLTDGRVIGGVAQAIAAYTSASVTNACVGGGVAAPTATHSHFPLNEGSGTVANDDTGNANHGTVSAGVTWVNDTSGTGVTIPTDATYRHIAHTFGSGVNPTTQNFAKCDYLLPDTSNVQKIVASSGGNGTNQRWYYGWTEVGGQLQWGIGVQASGFSTGSEFQVTPTLTLVCAVNDATADTVTLWVNGVKGIVSGASVKPTTTYTLVDHLRSGNDGTFSPNNGGYTVYESWVWNTKPSDADMLALYEFLTEPGSSAAGYAQVAHQAQLVYVIDGSPVNYGALSSEVEVIENGAVAIVAQIDCTGLNCPVSSFLLRHSTDGINFNLAVPESVGLGGAGMWVSPASTGLNNGTIASCLSGGLTPATGFTSLTNAESTPIDLAQNACISLRWIVRVGAISGQSRWFKVFQANGAPLANGYTPSAGVRIKVVSPRSSGIGF